ncbi:MAG TPA: HhH-GPD-type base excision DNA repair protein [Acidimicrobiales bacterium]|nr:HhH-GPD-type base excision DNA repair protein [Acidimicrobiales bacterium]
MNGTLAVTGKPDADALLNRDPLALLIGMLLDQQVPMEWAFTAPYTLEQRLGHLDVTRIAAAGPEALTAAFCAKPALHRYPASMATRAFALCQHLVDEYAAQPATVWQGVETGDELYRRLRALPGFGDEKAKIFMAVLAKRRGIAPPGWAELALPFSDDTPRSVADIDGPEALQRVRAWKKQQKAKGKGKQD